MNLGGISTDQAARNNIRIIKRINRSMNVPSFVASYLAEKIELHPDCKRWSCKDEFLQIQDGCHMKNVLKEV